MPEFTLCFKYQITTEGCSLTLDVGLIMQKKIRIFVIFHSLMRVFLQHHLRLLIKEGMCINSQTEGRMSPGHGYRRR